MSYVGYVLPETPSKKKDADSETNKKQKNQSINKTRHT